MARRWAFLGIALLSALSVVHCGSSSVPPPLEGSGDDTTGDSGTPVKPGPTPQPDSSVVDSTVSPVGDGSTPVDSTVSTDSAIPNTDTGIPTGPASAMTLNPASINFGPVPCGTTAAAQTVQVINNSTAPVSLAFYFEQNSGSFSASFLNPTSGQNLGSSVASLAVSAAVSLVITPVAVPTAPQTANTTNGYGDTLQLVVNGGSNTKNAIPVKEGAQGVIFVFNTSTVNFGDVPVNSTSPGQTVRVTNNGSQAANFTLTASVNGGGANPFAVTEPSATLASGATVSLSATFMPGAAASSTGVIALAQADSVPLCGPLPAGVTLSGSGVSGNVGVAPTTLSFGNTPCGTAAPQQGIYLSNVGGTEAYHWTATLTSGAAFYTLSPNPAQGNVAIGAVSEQGEDGGAPTFTVIPNVIPTNLTSIANGGFNGAISITTNSPNDTPHQIQLQMTAEGAIIAVAPTGTISFPSWSVGQTETETLNFINSGNENATLNLIPTSPFSAPSQITVNAGSTQPVPISFLPSAPQAFPGTLTLSAASGTTICNLNTLPGGGSGIALAGTGVTPVPPAVTLSATSINFGPVPCGSTTTLPSTLSVQNTGATSFQVTASLQNGSSSIFTATLTPTSPDGGTSVAGGSETTVTVSLPQMPQTASITPNAYADVLQLLFTSPNGAARSINVPLSITASGAIMAFQPSAVQFGTVAVNSTTNLPFTVVNSGNLPAEVQLTFAGLDAGVSEFGFAPLGLVDVNANASAALQASFASANTNPQIASLQMTPSSKSTNHFCAPMPSPLTLNGQGSTSTTVVTPASIDFGLTPCGQQATQALVTIQNTASSGSITWTASFLSGSAYYHLSQTTGPVNAQSSGSFTITPVAIPGLPAGSPVTPDFYAATLQVSTGTGTQPQLIQLHQTAQGVILTSSGNGATNFTALNFGGVSVNQTATTQFTITNTGNVAVDGVQLANANPVFAVNPNDVSQDGGVGSPQMLVFDLAPHESLAPAPEMTFTPTTVGAASDTAIYTLPAGTVLCAPAPPNFALSGTGLTGIAVSPTSLNFGLVPCGVSVGQGSLNPGANEGAAGQLVSINNKGVASTFTATFGHAPPNYTLWLQTSPPPQASYTLIQVNTAEPLPAGAITQLLVVPNTIQVPASTTPNSFGDTLTISTTSVGDVAHNISISETAKGAFLAFTPLSIKDTYSTPDYALGATVTQNFSFTNSGNVTADFYMTLTMNQGNDSSPLETYPFEVQPCQAYSVSSPFPNQCAPPGSCSGAAGPYSLTLPEFCTNIPYTTAGSAGSLFAGQTVTGVIESTGYPSALNFSQALGFINVVTVSTNLCSLPVPQIPLSEPSF